MPRGLLLSRLPALLQQPAAAPGARAALLGGAAALPPAWCGGAGCVRAISEERLNASPEHLEDLFQRSLSRASRRRSQGVLLTTGREALALYREVLRYSNLFVWRDAQGRVFRDLIRQSARKEYEDARFETDPEIINKLIITGRDAMHRSIEAFMHKRARIIEEEAQRQPQQ